MGQARGSGAAPLTIFAIPKAFRGHIAVIQRNAIASWMRMNPRPDVILFGTDEGTAEVARELGVQHVPTVQKNQWGTPLVGDLFVDPTGENLLNHMIEIFSRIGLAAAIFCLSENLPPGPQHFLAVVKALGVVAPQGGTLGFALGRPVPSSLLGLREIRSKLQRSSRC